MNGASDHQAPDEGFGDLDDILNDPFYLDEVVAQDNDDHVKKQFEADVKQAEGLIKDLSHDNTNQQDRLNAFFMKDRMSNWSKRTLEQRNFLHHLAYNLDKSPSAMNLKWLVQGAFLKQPDLMGQLDQDQLTPLSAAFNAENKTFIFVFSDKESKRVDFKQLKESLLIECRSDEKGGNTTCLHRALKCHFKGDFQQKMIECFCSFVPERMFEVVDNYGRTPLHIAVEYNRCCKTQVSIVEELLRRGPNALGVDSTRVPLSVYQHHEDTKKNAEEARRQAESKRSKFRRPQDQESDSSTLSSTERNNSKFGPVDEKPDPRRMSASKTGGMEPRILPRFDVNQFSRPSPINSLQPSSRSQEVSHLGPSPYSNQAGSSRDGATLPNDRQVAVQEERDAAAKDIAHRLQSAYLRDFSPNDVSRCLCDESEPDKHFWFDFGELRKISKSEFQKRFDHLRLNRALQYVALPQFRFDEEDSTMGYRDDFVFFFEWLKKKGVQQIFKVIVDDLKAPSHSDDAIQKSLKQFNVETLDWRKVDLDPLCLRQIGKSLTEVHLRWSGKNAVLRAWSEREGLASMQTLTDIHIIQVGKTEPSERVMENLKSFKSRLLTSWEFHRLGEVSPTRGERNDVSKPNVKWEIMDDHQYRVRSTQFDAQSQQQSTNPHKWIKCMEEFARRFEQIPVLRDKKSSSFHGPVEVALIDDGINLMHSDFKNKTIFGRSFHHYKEGSIWRVSPYWDSSAGHGTRMARYILRICPSAVIHVLKLRTFSVQGSSRPQIDPESALQAIQYANTLGVKIISMSWTMKKPDGKSKDDFDKVINTALNDKKKLLFCAASDQGKTDDATYPCDSNSKIFKIGGAKASATETNAVGDVSKLDYLFPGHDVKTDDDVFEDLKTIGDSGSSVATALAAGLAALIYECVRLGITTDPTRQHDPAFVIRNDDLMKICDREKMKKALDSIGLNSSNKYIKVWEVFEKAAENLKENEGVEEVQLDVIAGLARHFLKRDIQS